MTKDRRDALAEMLRFAVFATLDREPDVDGDAAGRVAAAVERAFKDALLPECEGCGDTNLNDIEVEHRVCSDCNKNRESARQDASDLALAYGNHD